MPSINWLTARAEIATILSTVAITSPVASTIARVYETQPKQASDFPCVIIMGTAKGPPERSSGLRQRDYTARLRLLVQDADINRAADIIDAFQEAIVDAFDQNLTLNTKVSNLNGPEWEEPATLDAGGQNQQGADGFVTFRMLDNPGFAG